MLEIFLLFVGAKGQESLEEEFLAKMEAEVREELKQTIRGDEVKCCFF